MPPAANLKSFFTPTSRDKDRAQEDVETSPLSKKRKIHTSPKIGLSSSGWLAADERRQLERAIQLSLRDTESDSTSSATLVQDTQEVVKNESDQPGNLASNPLAEAKEQPAETSSIDPSASPKAEEQAPKKQKATTPTKPQQQQTEASGSDQPSTSLPVAPLFAKQHPSAVFGQPIPPPTFQSSDFAPLSSAQPLTQSGLDCLFLPSWLGTSARQALRNWMLTELQWHRVCYVRPGGFKVNTPRFTTTFGIDDSGRAISAYKIRPKEIPGPLMLLKETIEKMQNEAEAESSSSVEQDPSSSNDGVRYNALIINYYATGDDSISYHADDEAFLGPLPNIASLSLGATRDFYLRRKAPEGVEVAPATSASGSKGSGPAATRPTIKLALTDGSLLIMKGRTQADWEHSIPKRKNLNQGRINITFRRAQNPKAIDNFLTYNRGAGFSKDKTAQGDGDGGGLYYRFRNGKMVEGKGGI